MRSIAPTILLWATLLATTAAAQPTLSIPLDCEPGRDCWVQSLPDIDPGPDRRDAFCGAATYDGHKGTDFRLADDAAMLDGVDVLAMAPGRVLRVRDGIQAGDPRPDLECGNGVVIDHGDGWTSQSCHLWPDSIVVAPGMRVRRGQRIGRVGVTGFTEYPHVHVTLREGDRVVDPATGRLLGAAVRACRSDGTLPAASLWDEAARAAIAQTRTAIITATFANGPLDGPAMDAGGTPPPDAASPFVFGARAINVIEGDRLALEVVDADGATVVDKAGERETRPRALVGTYAGRRTPQAPGDYVGRARLIRDGAVIAERTVRLRLE